MALPLLKIANNRDLEKLAISPLLADLNQSAGSVDKFWGSSIEGCHSNPIE